MDDGDEYMNFSSPEEYLKYQYSIHRENIPKLAHIDLGIYFKLARNKYGDDNFELYESDKILFEELQRLALDLEMPIKEQDENVYRLLNRHYDNVLKIAKENNIYIDKNITLGILPVDDSDECVKAFPNNKLLLAVNCLC